MNEKFNRLKKIVTDFENNLLKVEDALDQINNISTKVVDKDWLLNYWTSTNLDDFIAIISTPEIENWRELDDESSLALIKEAMSNITSDAIFLRNSEALERRYSKPSGTLSI